MTETTTRPGPRCRYRGGPIAQAAADVLVFADGSSAHQVVRIETPPSEAPSS
jgi:hypothetical protein